MDKRENYKGAVLHSLEKKRSPKKVDFVLPKGEDWFVDIIEYQKKSGEVKHTSMITMNDVETMVDRYCRISGYHEVEK